MNEPRRPDLFIVGAPKSGTTSLYEYLSGHPQIFMSPTKEPFYFNPDVRVRPRPRLEHPADESRYMRLFAAAGDARRVGEATTRYLVSDAAPALVRDFQPAPYVVVSLREPVAMIQALHSERVSSGNEDIIDFGAALAADEDRRHGLRLPPGSNALGAVYRANARYGALLERWIGGVGRERVHVIVFDDLASDPTGVFERLLRFLEVDPDYRPSSFAVRNRRHRPRRAVRAFTDSRLGRLFSEQVLTTVVGADRRARLAQRFRRSQVARRSITAEPIAPEVRRALEAEFAPDIAHLSELLGRDLTSLWWGDSKPPRLPAKP